MKIDQCFRCDICRHEVRNDYELVKIDSQYTCGHNVELCDECYAVIKHEHRAIQRGLKAIEEKWYARAFANLKNVIGI